MAARRPASKRPREGASQEVADTMRIIRRMPPAGFPKSKRVRMRYATTATINPDGTGVPAWVSIRANGMFDPEVAVGGHQPMGFDQWMTVYDHFTVTESVISVRPLLRSATSGIPGVYGVTLDDTAAFPYGTLSPLLESGLTNRHPKTYGLVEGIGGGADPMVRKAFRARKFFGTRAVVGEDELKGSASGDPTEQAYFHIWACSPGAGVSPDVQIFQVIVDYVAVLTEPKALPSS